MVHNDSTPVLSIVMPTYNGAAYIDDALDSLLNQSFTDYELLICDAGSTDATLRLIEARQDDRIRIVSRADRNLPDGINIGFQHAKGKIFAWLNCDDVYLHADALFRVVAAFNAHGGDYLLGVSGMLSETGEVNRLLVPWVTARPFRYRGHSNVFTGSLFFTRAAWSSFGGFPTEHGLAFEYALLKHLLRPAFRGRVLPAPAVAGFRIRADSLSGANTEKMRKQQAAILGERVLQPMPLFHRLVRLWSHLVAGQWGHLITVHQLNRSFPEAWRRIY